MKNIRIIGMIILIIAAQHGALGHAVWIETPLAGKLNAEHPVQIYYGEFNQGQRDSLAHWYSDMRELELWLQSPSGETSRLQTHIADDHLTSLFVPKEEGTYLVYTVHGAKDLGGTTKYEFSSAVRVVVGSNKGKDLVPKLPFLLTKTLSDDHTLNSDIHLQVLQNGTPLAGAEVLVMGPQGWSKPFATDQEGKVSFQPLWEGQYVIEASQYKPEKGEWKGHPYTHLWQGSTTTLYVK